MRNDWPERSHSWKLSLDAFVELAEVNNAKIGRNEAGAVRHFDKRSTAFCSVVSAHSIIDSARGGSASFGPWYCGKAYLEVASMFPRPVAIR